MVIHHLAPVISWHTVHLVSETLEHVGGVATTEVVVIHIEESTFFLGYTSEEVNNSHT